MIVADVSGKVVHFLAEIFPESHVLIELMWEFEDWAIHNADVVDWMCFHGVDDDREINGSDYDVVMLKDKHKLVRDLLHDVLDILCKPMPFIPLLNKDPLILLILLPQSLLKPKVIILLLCGDDAAFELASTNFYNLSPITYDEDSCAVEGRFFSDAVDGLIDHFCCGVGSDRTGCDDDCQIERG